MKFLLSLFCIIAVSEAISWSWPSGTSLAPFKLINNKISFGDKNIDFAADPAGGSAKVIRVKYPKGSFSPSHGTVGGVGFYSEPIPLREKATFEYQVYFPSDFNFVKGGKLGGLYGGKRGCSGGDDAVDCFSTRYMWRTNGAGEVYAYFPIKNQDPNFCKINICNPDYGNSINRGSFTFVKGKWNTIKMSVQLNTPGVRDGKLRVWHNGNNVISYDNLIYREKGYSFEISGIMFDTFFGGSSSDWATPKDTFTYFKGFSLNDQFQS